MGRCSRDVVILVAIACLASAAGGGGSVLAAGPYSVGGTVRDEGGRPVAGALVVAAGLQQSTDSHGAFELALPPAVHTLRVAHREFLPVRIEVLVEGDVEDLEIRLRSLAIVSDTVTVDAIRAAEEVPVTKRTMERDEIDRLSYGQDMPEILSHTPSLTWYSDSGRASNYSYFSLRGINQSRINITLDGAPLNDPAEHALYFNNFHDFASAVDSIQIQRGVGTSSVGSPAYGGSVNFASVQPSSERRFEARLGYGSDDTRRASVAVHTGLFDNGLSFYGRVSCAASDGYRERSGTEHDSAFFNALWQGEKSQLRLVSFSGRGRSGLAFLAVDPATLDENPRFNALAAEERDSFGQDFAQLQYVRSIGASSVLTAALYYNGADGWFRLWDDAEEKGDLLEFGIDQHFVGSMVTVAGARGRLATTVGIHYNDFRGGHTLDVAGRRLYSNSGLKEQANAFVKLGYDLGEWSLYGDLQLRRAVFDYLGDLDLGSVSWAFLDPKVGVRYALSPTLSVYASLGKAEREPGRLDLLAGEDNASVVHDLEAVEPERVIDLELGIEYRSAEVVLQAALYGMEFDNEIAATGELSDVGLPLRTNVDESYRRGLELDLRWQPTPRLSILHSTSLSRNRIRRWTQFYDVYDESGQWVGSEARVHREVPPLLTPEVIVDHSIEWSGDVLDLAVSGRYVGASQLDNTGDSRFRVTSFVSMGVRAGLELARFDRVGRPRLSLRVDNLLGETDHYAAGYSYQFVTRSRSGRESIDGIPYYYPQAGRSFAMTVEFSL